MADRRLGDDRLDFLAEAADLLWPGAALRFDPRGTQRGGRSSRAFLLVGTRRYPRLLVPVERAAAAAAVRAQGTRLGRRARIRSSLAAAGILVGAAGAFTERIVLDGVSDGNNIDDVLSNVLEEPVRVALHLGSRRPNQKPVLQVLKADGTIAAFVKVGSNALTAELVRREAHNLETVAAAPRRTFRTPRPLAMVEWRGLPILVLEPLVGATWTRDPHPATIAAVASEIAELDGHSSALLADSAYWHRIREHIASLPPGPGETLQNLMRQVEAQHGHVAIRFGAAHGDFSSWNMGVGAGTLLLWDWERFAGEIPVGFDLLHFVFYGRLLERRSQVGVAAACCAEARAVCIRLGAPEDNADSLAALYLLSLILRHELDAQRQPSNRPRALLESLMGTLREAVSAPALNA
jgi:hypothetical protein